jgi:aminoglycoside/choline kinase family phosphotransferase
VAAAALTDASMQPSTPRGHDADLDHWLQRLGHPPSRIEPLAGDVSARRYLRVTSGRTSLIVAVYPPATRGDCKRFLATGELLVAAGVRVPEVLASDCERGWMLLEDLGRHTLYDLRRRGWQELAPHLERAAAAARRIAGLPHQEVAAICPPLDPALLERELEQTWRVFLLPRGLGGDGAAAAALRSALGELCRRLGEPEPVPCHRDFMARNLVPRARGGPVVLDHQDLRLGPPLYDLASLCNDSLFPPPELVAELLGGRLDDPADRLAYRRAAAQRGLKAVGTFAAFAERGNPRHLALVPPTLGRALEHLEELPETAAAIAPLADRWRAIC